MLRLRLHMSWHVALAHAFERINLFLHAAVTILSNVAASRSVIISIGVSASVVLQAP